MIIKEVLYFKNFIKDLKRLPQNIIEITFNKERLFKVNPLHSSLRLHGLKGKFEGLWSLSITKSYRLIFKRKGTGVIIFISIGKHDIYKCL